MITRVEELLGMERMIRQTKREREKVIKDKDGSKLSYIKNLALKFDGWLTLNLRGRGLI